MVKEEIEKTINNLVNLMSDLKTTNELLGLKLNLMEVADILQEKIFDSIEK